MKKLTFILVSTLLITGCSTETSWVIHSPDNNIKVALELDRRGALSYSATRVTNDETVTALERSPLGLITDMGSFAQDLTFVSAADDRSISETYSLVTGKKRNISYVANEASFAFRNAEDNEMEIIFRVTNEGLAFRYHFPEVTGSTMTVSKELTGFNVPDIGKCWSQPYDTLTRWSPAYETYYVREMDIGTPAPDNKNGWSFPLTVRTEDLWMLISESNLDGNYAASHLEQNCDQGLYVIRFPEPGECFGKHPIESAMQTPGYTPWRLIIIGESPATIMESTMVTDLADPSRIEDVSWIKPGRAAWSWWSDSESPSYVREQNRFTDLAADMGWEYNLIDANWDKMNDGVVTNAIDYASERGIGAILWYNSGGNHNSVDEAPRDKMWDPEIRAAEFEKIAGWGVKGVKVDFFQSDKQAIINQYLGILEDAANNEIVVNFHGCTLPRGWRRTWPNMVTLESVRGAEVYKFGRDYPEKAPWHNTILPFTRNAVGPMDYTPVTFSDQTYPHLTTYAHELALSVVFESGIIHMADKVEAYQGLPEQAKQFLMDVPAAWDDIRFIDGYPGRSVILARRAGDTWYLAGINGQDTPAEHTVSLDFVDAGKSIQLIADGEDDTSFEFSSLTLGEDKEMIVQTLPFGGFAAIIK